MVGVARSVPGIRRVGEVPLFAAAVMLLTLAAAALPGAVVGAVGAEGIRNHLLAGVPGFVLLVGWWLAHAGADPDATFWPGRASWLASGVLAVLLGLVGLLSARATGVPGMNAADAAVTGACLLAVGGGACIVATVRRSL